MLHVIPDQAQLRTDYLKHLLDLYYPLHFFALFRAHELYNVEPYIDLLEPPILDLGCGDGAIATLLFHQRLEYGVDLDKAALRRAQQQQHYGAIFRAGGHTLPFRTASIGGVFSNCVLEHIPDMPQLIGEVARVLRPGGYFVATCLSPFYYSMNSIFHLAQRPGLHWLRRKMIQAENRLHNHVSVLPVEEYRQILADHGMQLEFQRYYATEPVARFCNTWDTASKYRIPFPAMLGHAGLLVFYLYFKYKLLGNKQAVTERWYQHFYPICYDRNEANQPGVAQVIVARKCV